jgi:hypothetical protein
MTPETEGRAIGHTVEDVPETTPAGFVWVNEKNPTAGPCDNPLWWSLYKLKDPEMPKANLQVERNPQPPRRTIDEAALAEEIRSFLVESFDETALVREQAASIAGMAAHKAAKAQSAG